MPAHPPSASASHCTLEIKVIPNAPRDEVAGWLGAALKVKVHAPALEGRANAALTEFLADCLELPGRAVALVRGERSNHKLIRIDGLSLDETRRRLSIPKSD